jgi:hypothetical protein
MLELVRHAGRRERRTDPVDSLAIFLPPYLRPVLKHAHQQTVSLDQLMRRLIRLLTDLEQFEQLVIQLPLTQSTAGAGEGERSELSVSTTWV